MDYRTQIEQALWQLRRIGYNDEALHQVIEHYIGSPLWTNLPVQEQRRLAFHLRRYVPMARKLHYQLTGCLM